MYASKGSLKGKSALGLRNIVWVTQKTAFSGLSSCGSCILRDSRQLCEDNLQFTLNEKAGPKQMLYTTIWADDALTRDKLPTGWPSSSPPISSGQHLFLVYYFLADLVSTLISRQLVYPNNPGRFLLNETTTGHSFCSKIPNDFFPW